MKTSMKKILALVLALVMVCGMLTACDRSRDGNEGDPTGGAAGNEETITLTVFSELANYSGEQVGWVAKMLKEKFNVVLNIIPSTDGVYETRMESGFLGDIVVWGGDGENYTRALEAGMLYDWNADNLLQEYGPYIYENMQDALQKNANLTATATATLDENGKIVSLGEPIVYGFGHDVAAATGDHASFFYTWDIRWDLYKELGYPEMKNMDDMLQIFKDMKALCPTDDNGNETYAVSMWPDWDGDMVMYVKSFATAYYGFDEHGVGLYDPKTGAYHDALEQNGPYLSALKFFNQLYQNDLLDPNSMTQTYDNMYEKVQAGGVFFSMFNYSGSLGFNSEAHMAADKMMCSLVPEEASPIVYSLSPEGGGRIWSIGSNTEHPEKCMEIINWLATPEGVMTYYYGPKDLCWYYDDEGYTHWTDFGKTVYFARDTQMIGEYEGTGDFNSGCLQINNNTWSLDAVNPESNNERFNYQYWRSYLGEAGCATEQDWRDRFGVETVEEYMSKTNYSICDSFTFASRSDEFKTTWSAVTDIIVTYSWKAIYANSDAEFNYIVNQMIQQAKAYGYEECVQWGVDQAAARYALEG